MPNIEMLIGSISQHLTERPNDHYAYFSILELKFAYSQLQLPKDTAKHCICNVTCGKTTGTFRINIGFYGSIKMPAQLQKAMAYTLIGGSNTFCFLDVKNFYLFDQMPKNFKR